MDLSFAEDSQIAKLSLGMLLALLFGFIPFLWVQNRNVIRVSVSLATDLNSLARVYDVVDDLNRLILAHRAFLITNDDELSDEVVKSIMMLQEDLAALNRLASGSGLRTADISTLDHAVDGVLNAIRRSYEIGSLIGPTAAVSYLDDAPAMSKARIEAQKVQRDATTGILDIFNRQRGIGPVLEALF